MTVLQSGCPGVSVATHLLLAVALLSPLPIRAQAAPGSPQNHADSAEFYSASLEGSVRDSTGRPVAGAIVYLQVKDGTETLSAQADAAGSYRFSGLAAGIYVLRVEMAGYSQATAGSCVIGPKEAKRLDLTLESSKSSPAPASAPGKSSQRPPEFFDEPQFTVAGVTDSTNLGGHGSNTIVRTKESLAKDIASLNVSAGKASTGSIPPASNASVSVAEASLRATAERQPGNFEANHRLGKFMVEHGRPQESLAYLERASQLRPGDNENASLLALAYADAGQYQQARTKARVLLMIEEKARPGLSKPDQARPDQAGLHHLLGDIDEKLGDPLEAVREYQRAADLDPTESNFFDWGSELLLHRAVEPAIEVFGKGNRLFPRSARMLIALGVAWYSNGSYDQAARRLCEASDLDPGDLKPYLFLGKIQGVETTPSECSGERLKRLVKLQPANALANYYYGVNLWKRRKGPDDAESGAQAESLLKRAVELDPKLGVGYLQLGVLYSERRDLSRALASYQDAVRASPELEEAHYRLAQAYKQTGEKTKAEEELQLYNQISKSKDEEVERERRESRQFVYTPRSPGPGAESR